MVTNQQSDIGEFFYNCNLSLLIFNDSNLLTHLLTYLLTYLLTINDHALRLKIVTYFSMCWTTYPNTCLIRVAGSRYYSAKAVGPVTHIVLL